MPATLPTLPTEIQTLILDLLLQNTPLHSPKFQERLVISRRVFDVHVGRLYEDIVLHEGNAKRFIAALDVGCAGDLIQMASSPTPVPYSQFPSSASRKWTLIRTAKRLTIKDRQALRIVGRCADLYRDAMAEPNTPFPAVEWLVFTSLKAEDESRSELARAFGEEMQSLSRVGFINPHVCVDVASGSEFPSVIADNFYLFSHFFDSCQYKGLTVHNSHAAVPVTQGRTGADIHVFLRNVDADDEEAGDQERTDLIFKAVDWFHEDPVNGAVGDRSRYSWVAGFKPSHDARRMTTKLMHGLSSGVMSITYHNARISYDNVLECIDLGIQNTSNEKWEERKGRFRVYEKGEAHGYICGGCGLGE